MSEIVATTKVRIEADASGLKQQAETQVKAAIPQKIEIPLTVADLSPAQKAALQEAGAAKAQLADTRRELAGLEEKLKDFTQARRQAEAAGGPILEAFKRQQEAFAKTPQPTDEPAVRARAEELRLQVGLEETLANAAAKRAREQLTADQAAVAGANEAAVATDKLTKAELRALDAEKKRQGIGGFLRAGAAGRTSGLAGIVGAGLRLGGIGIAATAAFQAVGELQQSLRVTGNEAFTAEGKLRNLGAELLGGNIIGGIKALTAVRKAEFTGDLGDQITAQLEKQKAAADPLSISMEKLNLVHQQGEAAVSQWVKSMIDGEHITLAQGAALLEVNSKLDSNTKVVEASATAWANYSAAVDKAGGSLDKAFGPDSRANRQIPTVPAGTQPGDVIGRQRTGIPRDIIQPDRTVFRAGTGGTDVAAQIRASIDSRIQDDAKLAAAKVREAKIEAKIAQANFDVAKQVAVSEGRANGAAAEYLKLVQANTAVADATAAAEATAKTAAQHAQDLATQVRESRIATISDPIAAQQARVANARILEQNAKTALEATKKGTQAQKDADAAYRIAINNRIAEQNQLTALNQQAAQAAAQAARNAKEQRLQNEITAAEMSGDIPRIKRAFDTAITYWRSIANNAKLADEEQENARGVVLGLIQAKKAALKPEDVADIKAAKLQNDIAFAELKGLDTRPFLRALIRFTKGAMDSAVKGTQAYESARAAWIQASGNFKSSNQTLNDLKKANARARAALTETTTDDERLIRADIRYWTRRVRQTKGMGIVHQRAIQELLKAEGDLKGLVDEVKPTTTVFDLLTEATRSFTEHAGNLINARSRFTADTFTSGIGSVIGTTPNAAGRARLGLDDGALRSSIDRNTEAVNRNTVTIRGGEPRGHPPAAGATTVTVRTSGSAPGFGQWRESFWARSARAGIN